MLFFAGRVPPPFPPFVLCSSISFICGIAAGVLAFFSMGISPEPQDLAQCIILFISAFCFAGLLLLTTLFFVPTFGLAADDFWLFQTLALAFMGLISFPQIWGYVSYNGVDLQRDLQWLLGHGCLYGIAYSMALVASSLRRVVRMRLKR